MVAFLTVRVPAWGAFSSTVLSSRCSPRRPTPSALQSKKRRLPLRTQCGVPHNLHPAPPRPNSPQETCSPGNTALQC